MPGIARVGDIAVGTCCCHEDEPQCRPFVGIVSTGAGTIIIEGQQAARIGDIVIGDCGHTGIISTGMGNVMMEGIGAATIGSIVVGCLDGIIVTGAGTVTAGG